MDSITRLCIDGARSWASAEAGELGVSRWTLWRWGQRGALAPLGRGLYGIGALVPDEIAAAAFACRGVISHQSAALHWDIELVEPSQLMHITVGRDRSRVSADRVHVHRADLAPGDVDLGELPVTTPLRTILDLAQSLDLAHAVAAADSALRRRLITVEQLRIACTGRRGRGAARLRRMLALVDPRAESVLESLLRVLLVEGGLMPDATQAVIRDRAGNFVGRVDFWYRLGLVVEADGFAFHSDRAAYRRDRRLSNALTRLRVWMLRFTWEDVLGDPAGVLALVRDVLADAPGAHKLAPATIA